jgi:hypothetical protein
MKKQWFQVLMKVFNFHLKRPGFGVFFLYEEVQIKNYTFNSNKLTTALW